MRTVPNKASALAVLFLAVLVGCGGVEEPSAPAAAGLEVSSHGAGPLEWETVWEQAFDRADREGKLVMVDFYADWCIWCKRLDSTTYRDRTVTAYLADRVVPLKMDVDGSGRELAQRHRVDGLPTIVLFAPDGREVGRIAGYLPAQEFLTQVRQMQPQQS